MRVTDLSGASIRLGFRRARSGDFRMTFKKITYEEQLAHAFELFDISMIILEQVN